MSMSFWFLPPEMMASVRGEDETLIVGGFTAVSNSVMMLLCPFS